MNASFYALFRRGKYGNLRPGLEGALNKIPHEERERFVAAALGFTLRHSKTFRVWFFKDLLRFRRHFYLRDSSDIAISMDEHQWADIMLERRTKPSFLTVIETKTGSSIKTHQDMRHNEFWQTGYGLKLKEARKNRRYDKVQYCILDLHRQSVKKPRSGIDRLSCSWHDLAKSAPQNERLVADFVELLINIGLPLSTTNNPKQMRTDTLRLNDLCRIHHELRAIANEYEFKLLKQEQIGELDNAYFGSKFRIPKTMLIIGNVGESLTGWFGWHIIDQKVKCALWFYCPPIKGVGSRLFNRLKKAGFKPSEDKDGESFNVSRTPKQLADDAQWLRSIFESLMK